MYVCLKSKKKILFWTCSFIYTAFLRLIHFLCIHNYKGRLYRAKWFNWKYMWQYIYSLLIKIFWICYPSSSTSKVWYIMSIFTTYFIIFHSEIQLKYLLYFGKDYWTMPTFFWLFFFFFFSLYDILPFIPFVCNVKLSELWINARFSIL